MVFVFAIHSIQSYICRVKFCFLRSNLILLGSWNFKKIIHGFPSYHLKMGICFSNLSFFSLKEMIRIFMYTLMTKICRVKACSVHIDRFSLCPSSKLANKKEGQNWKQSWKRFGIKRSWCGNNSKDVLETRWRLKNLLLSSSTILTRQRRLKSMGIQ